jgi:hypothetical protein
MRARPNPSGEQLVTEYLARVAQEARLLPKGARMAFVGRTKALIERELGPRTRTEPEQVLALLDRLGPPEDLVRDERTRIDRRWVKSRAASKEEGEAAAAALTEPLNRSLPSRRRLNTDTWPFGRPAQAEPEPGTGPSAPSEGAGPRRSGLGSGGPRSTGLRGVGPRSAGLRSPGPRSAGPRATIPPAAGPLGTGPLGTGPQGTGPAGTGRTGRLGRLARKGTGTRGQRRNEALADAWQLARDNLRESIAILLLGLGGLILPFPFWPIGAVVAMFSRLWDVKDKLLAVTGPLLVALAGSVLTAPFIGGSGNIILVYTHALGAGFGLMIRVGSVLTAAYLAWRVSRGPRIKVPPWKRITR